MLEKPKNEVRRTDTCQGQRPNGALLPPTMRVSGRVKTGTPHSVENSERYIDRGVSISRVSLKCQRMAISVNLPLRAAETVFMVALVPSKLSPISFDSIELMLCGGRVCKVDNVVDDGHDDDDDGNVDVDVDDDNEDDNNDDDANAASELVVVVETDEEGLIEDVVVGRNVVVFVGKTPVVDNVVVGFLV